MYCCHSKPKVVYTIILLVALIVSEQQKSSASEAGTLNKSNTDQPITNNNKKNYLVKNGDTLYSIGLRTGHGYQNLALWNQLSPPYMIFAGQRIKLFNSAVKNQNLESPNKIIPIKEAKNAAASTAKENHSAGIIVLKKQSDGPATQNRPDMMKKSNSSSVAKKQLSDQPKKSIPAKDVAKEANNATVSTVKEKHSAEIIVIKKQSSPVATQNKPDINKKSAISISNKKMLKLSFKWPIKGNVLESFSGNDIQGIDITNKNGKQPVAAAEAGQVVYIGQGLNNLKNLIIIKHNDVYLSAYANNHRPVVREGQQVKSGQTIAEIGTAENKKISLHFEIRQNGKPVNPLNLLSK